MRSGPSNFMTRWFGDHHVCSVRLRRPYKRERNRQAQERYRTKQRAELQDAQAEIASLKQQLADVTCEKVRGGYMVALERAWPDDRLYEGKLSTCDWQNIAVDSTGWQLRRQHEAACRRRPLPLSTCSSDSSMCQRPGSCPTAGASCRSAARGSGAHTGAAITARETSSRDKPATKTRNTPESGEGCKSVHGLCVLAGGRPVAGQGRVLAGHPLEQDPFHGAPIVAAGK